VTSETPSYEDVVHALRTRLAGSPQLRHQPAENISHDLMANGYLPTEPPPALVRKALQEIHRDQGGASRACITPVLCDQGRLFFVRRTKQRFGKQLFAIDE
jgi:pyridoxal/pyridoxine/pyridoxamine kinase